jgi:hypothetical protein
LDPPDGAVNAADMMAVRSALIIAELLAAVEATAVITPELTEMEVLCCASVEEICMRVLVTCPLAVDACAATSADNEPTCTGRRWVLV